jgi:hypothetical protein
VSAGSQTVNLSGDVYRLAVGTLGSSVLTLAAVREGTAFGIANVAVGNAASTDGFSEKLNVSLGGANGDANVVGGSVSLLAAGSTSSVLQVSLGGTLSAGAKSGTVFANFVSDGTGTSGFGAIDAGSQALSVSGKVYRLAAGSLSTNSLNLGNIRVGGAVSASAVTIGNVATADNYSDLLVVNGTASGGFTLGGGIQALSAGTFVKASVGYAGDVTMAGVKNGTLVFGLTSKGQVGTGLSDVGLAAQNVG